jgi:uncharacterized membrane protein YfcA
MTHLELIVLLVVGIISGFLNVMAGGGSMLTVPLMIFMGIPGHIANGTNRIGIMVQNITATVAFYKKGFSNFKLSLSLAAFTIPGAIAGAYLASNIEGKDFNRLLVVLMIIVMIMMATGSSKNPSKKTEKITKKKLVYGHLLMVAAGFWGGLIQIGVGFILMPIMHRVMGMDLVTTNSHKVFITLIFSIAALLVFSSQLELLWSAGIALAIGNSIGGWFATSFQIKQGAGTIKWVLNIVLVAFIIKLLFFQN